MEQRMTTGPAGVEPRGLASTPPQWSDREDSAPGAAPASLHTHLMNYTEWEVLSS